MLHRVFYICSFAVLTAVVVAPVLAQTKQVWPFDQRQIALVKKADKNFPDEATVAVILDVFVKKGRVRWVTQKAGAAQIVPLEVPVDFRWQSAQSIRNLGLKLKTDGLLLLTQKGVQIDLSWYSTVDGQPLFYESVSLPDSNKSPEQETMRKQRLVQWLGDIWGRIPGSGYVIKRDLKTLTIEGAPQVGLKVGDKVVLRRLEKMERHALLKTVIGMSSSTTGVGKIISIDGQFALVDIEYESQIDPIQSGDRYEVSNETEKKSAVLTPEVQGANREAELKMIDQDDGRKFVPLFDQSSTESATADSPLEGEEPKYKILDVTALATYGRVTHLDTVTTETAPKEMSAYTPGFRLNLKGYVTKEILFLTDVDFTYLKFSGQTTNYGADTIASGLSGFRLAGGYRYIFLPAEDQPGEIDFHVGMRRFGIAMGTTSALDAPLAKSYVGWDIGANVIVPIVKRYAGFFKFSKMIWAGLTETPSTSGASPSNDVWQFEVGARYRYNPSTELVAGIVFDSAASSFTGAGTRTVASTAFELSSTLYQMGATFKY